MDGKFGNKNGRGRKGPRDQSDGSGARTNATDDSSGISASATGPVPSVAARHTPGSRRSRRAQGDIIPSQEVLPSARERLAELSVSRPVLEEKGSEPPSMAELSKQIDSAFSVSMSPTSVYDKVLISTLGYQRLVIETYRAIVAQEDKAKDLLSAREFFLFCGWLLYKRILEIQQRWLVFPVDVFPFLNAFPKNLDVPVPIKLYLEGLGALKTTTGNILLPNLYVPQGGGQASCASYPSQWLEDGTNAAPPNVPLLSFFPLGITLRRMNFQVAPAGYGGNVANTYLYVVGAVNAGVDANLARLFCYTLLDELPDASAIRAASWNQAFWAGFQADNTILGRMRFNPYLFRDYLAFASRTRKKYQYCGLDLGFGGSSALQAYSRPTSGDHANAMISFTFHSSFPLSKAEMQAARVFKYRQDADIAARCCDVGGADLHNSVNASPGPLHAPATMQFTEIGNDPAFVSYFCDSFNIRV